MSLGQQGEPYQTENGNSEIEMDCIKILEITRELGINRELLFTFVSDDNTLCYTHPTKG